MNVSDFMTTDPVTVESSASLAEAIARMDDLRIRHLPVVDAGKLVGVLSNRDLLEVPCETGLVKEAMHAEVAIVTPDTTSVALALEVIMRGIGCLPVLEDETLVGIVTELDILRAYVEVAREGKLTGRLDPSIETLMTRKVRTVADTDTLDKALGLLRELNVRHTPVVQDAKLLGILSDRDLRRAHGNGLPNTTAVADVMTKNVRTMSSTASLSKTAALMVEHKIGALPVVEGDALAGILTSTDVVEHCLEVLR